MKSWKWVLGIAAFVTISGCVVMAEPAFNPASLVPAGTLNTHDMDTLKKFEMEKQEEKDFERYKENNEQKEQEIKKRKNQSKS